MTPFLQNVIAIAMFLQFIAIAFSMYRIIRGPSLPDRIVSIDLIATVIVGLLASLAIQSQQKLFLTAGIALALLAFLGTVAMANYIRRGGPP